MSTAALDSQEQKFAETSEQKQSSHHKKPGTLGDKLGVLTEATVKSMEPALNWISQKTIAVLPESITHAQEDAFREARRKEALAAANIAPSPPPPALPTLTQAANDFGDHIGESMTKAFEPLTQYYLKKFPNAARSGPFALEQGPSAVVEPPILAADPTEAAAPGVTPIEAAPVK